MNTGEYSPLVCNRKTEAINMEPINVGGGAAASTGGNHRPAYRMSVNPTIPEKWIMFRSMTVNNVNEEVHLSKVIPDNRTTDGSPDVGKEVHKGESNSLADGVVLPEHSPNYRATKMNGSNNDYPKEAPPINISLLHRPKGGEKNKHCPDPCLDLSMIPGAGKVDTPAM